MYVVPFTCVCSWHKCMHTACEQNAATHCVVLSSGLQIELRTPLGVYYAYVLCMFAFEGLVATEENHFDKELLSKAIKCSIIW